jgi:hypothetical protein
LKWLENHDDLSLSANIRSRLGSQSSRGSAYEELVVLYLLRVLRNPIPFSTVFTFIHTHPSWADELTQIVGRLDGNAVAVGVLGEAPQNPSLGVVHYAEGIEEVLHWIESPATAPAVLISTILFGPDLMIRSGDILLMGQLKSYTNGNKGSLDAATISHALTSLNPDHWFKKSVCPLVLSLCSAHSESCDSRLIYGRNSSVP